MSTQIQPTEARHIFYREKYTGVLIQPKLSPFLVSTMQKAYICTFLISWYIFRVGFTALPRMHVGATQYLETRVASTFYHLAMHPQVFVKARTFLMYVSV